MKTRPPLRILSLAALAMSALLALPAWAHGTHTKSIAAAPPVSATTGYVEEVVVQDLVRGSTQRFPVLVAEDGSRYVLRGPAADGAKAGASVVVRGNAGARAIEVVGIDPAPKADPRAAAAAARPSTSRRGTLRLGVAERFDDSPVKFFYSLVGDTGRVDVKLAYELGVLDNGSTATVTGRLEADGEIAPESIVVESASTSATQGAMGPLAITNQVLVIPIKFKNSSGVFPADPFTITAISDAVFGAAPKASVAEYYKEVSYGQQILTGTVAQSGGAWLQAANPAPSPSACDTAFIESQAQAAATAAGYNPSSYQNVVYLFANTGFSCGWLGLGYIGWGRSWVNQSISLLVIGHELGHNFGLLHAGSLDCGTASIGGTCSVSEYGEPFGIMGNRRAMHMSAMQKRILNWIPLSSTPTHTGGTQTYTLSPIETGGGATYAVRIPAASNRTYWVEYRQPIGFDASLSSLPNNGAQVRVAAPFEATAGSDDTQFVDMTPATTSFDDGALIAAQSFSDPLYGITITVLSASASALTVQVTKSGTTSTTTTVSSTRNPSTVGQSVTLNATVAGLAPTGSVAFLDGGVAIAGCSAVALAGSGDTRTAACTTTSLATGSHAIVASYSGDAGNGASSSAALTQTVNATGTTATTTTVASNRNPSTFGQSVTLTASVSGSAPTGTVAFRDAGTAIPSCSAVALTGSGSTRTATCTLASLGGGSHPITAAYSGDATNAASTSGSLSQVVNPASTTTTLAASANPAVAGAAVGYTATIAGSSPSGSVAFRVGSTTLSSCGAVAVASGKATCSAALPAGTYAITASYSGDANNAASASTTLTQSVVRAGVAKKRRDMDGDGRSDVLWRNASTGQTLLWLMNAGTIKSAALILGDANWQPAFTGDFDGDGRTDILWRHATSGEVVVWLMNGTTPAGGASVSTDPNWRVTLIADFNGDGIDDIVWRNASTGATRLTIMSGASFASTTTLMPDGNWTAIATGDFNGDGRADLAWRHAVTGEIVVWLMNGATIAGSGSLLADPNWTVTHVGDFNGDGKSDIVWRNTASGATALWLMNGAALASGTGLLGDPSWRVTLVDDVDGDGRSDLVWRNAVTGDVALWLMNGTALTSGVGYGVGTAWTIVGTGDYDGTSKADLVWRNTSTGETAMWLMNGLSISAGYLLSNDPNWSVVP